MSLWIIWLIATAVLLVIELLTGLVATFCVAVGCLIAFCFALAGFGIETQLGAMVVGVILAFIFLVPFINRFPRDTKLYQLMTTKPGEGVFGGNTSN